MSDKQIQDAYSEGIDAYFIGQDAGSNPYDPDLDETAHLEWDDGWNAGRDGDEIDEDMEVIE